MAEPQKKPGEDLLEGLRSQIGPKVPVSTTPSRQRLQQGPFTDPRDILAGIQSALPSRAERFVSSVVDGVISLGINAKDSTLNLLKSVGTITLMPAYITMLGLEALEGTESPIGQLASITATDIQRFAGSPKQAEEDFLSAALDTSFVAAGLGLGGLIGGGATGVGAGTRAVAGGFGRRVLRRSGVLALRGTQAGLIFSPIATSPETRQEGVTEQLVERGKDVAAFAAAEVLLVGPLGAAFRGIAASKPVRAGLGKLQERARRRTAQAITKEVIKASEFTLKKIKDVEVKGTGLTEGQFVRNTVPRALERLGQTSAALEAVERDLASSIGRAMEVATKVPTGPFKRVGLQKFTTATGAEVIVPRVLAKAPGGGSVTFALSKNGEPIKAIAPKLKEVLSEELAFAEGVMSAFVFKLSKNKSFNPKLLQTLVEQTKALRDTVIKNKTALSSLNDIISLQRNVDLLHRQWVHAYNEVFTEGPLRLWANAAKRLVRGKPQAGDMRALVVSMFHPFSFVQDSLGNSLRLSTRQVVARGVGDTTDLVLGRASAGQRTAAAVNALRNFNDARPFARELARGRYAAGIAVGETTGAGLAERTLENVLFIGVKLKGGVDTAARRAAIIFQAHDIGFKEAAKRGLTGVERQVYIQQRLAGPWTGKEQASLVRIGNEAAFIRPQGPGMVRFMEHPATQLFISPFVGFGMAWARFIAEFAPGLGTAPAMVRFMRSGRVPQGELEQLVAKQLTGMGAVVAADRTLYDHIDFDNPTGLLYRNLATGEEQLLQSPVTDFVFLDAIIRGDWGNAAKAAPNTGIVLLGGGLATRLTQLLLEDPSQSNLQRVGGEMAKMLDLAFPGRAVALAFADYFGEGKQLEPFTEGGVPVPPAIGALLGVTRTRIGKAGEAVAARRRPALPVPGVTFKVRGTFLGDALEAVGLEPEFPASFGTSVTVRDMTATDRFIEKARRNFGVRMDLRRATPVRSRGGWGQRVPVDQLPDEVTRYFLVKKAEFFAAQTAPNVDNPAVWSLSQDAFESYKNLWLSNAAQYAANQTLKRFPNLTAEGLLEPLPDFAVNPLTRQLVEEED